MGRPTPMPRLVVPLLVLACCVGCGSAGGPASAARAGPHSSVGGGSWAPVAPPSPVPVASATPDAGSLPQTRDRPQPAGARWDAALGGFWQSIVADQPALAEPMFFPRGAYLQVKAIADPAGDYERRLVHLYDLDLHAAHQTLGPDPAAARFVGVDVPESAATWVPPGAEYNKIGYWRVYGTRVHYLLAGQPHSFGIYSLISWRGEWYAVHLGPAVRPAVGMVYQPAG